MTGVSNQEPREKDVTEGVTSCITVDVFQGLNVFNPKVCQVLDVRINNVSFGGECVSYVNNYVVDRLTDDDPDSLLQLKRVDFGHPRIDSRSVTRETGGKPSWCHCRGVGCGGVLKD